MLGDLVGHQLLQEVEVYRVAGLGAAGLGGSLQAGRGVTGMAVSRGPHAQDSTSSPPSRATFPPKPGGLEMPRVLEGRPAYSSPASSAWQLLGAEGGPKPTQELWDKGRQGSLLPCWGGKRPWPSTQATTRSGRAHV